LFIVNYAKKILPVAEKDAEISLYRGIVLSAPSPENFPIPQYFLFYFIEHPAPPDSFVPTHPDKGGLTNDMVLRDKPPKP